MWVGCCFCSKTNVRPWNKFEIICVSKMELKSTLTSQSALLPQLQCEFPSPFDCFCGSRTFLSVGLCSREQWSSGHAAAESWTHLPPFCPAGRRKSATAQAVVYKHGSGKIRVNGLDYLLYFPVTQDRCGVIPAFKESMLYNSSSFRRPQFSDCLSEGLFLFANKLQNSRKLLLFF